MPVISVFQQKGGVGKTTITANLAGELQRRGHSVALFDLDPQRSLTALATTAERHEGLLRGLVRTVDIEGDGLPSLEVITALRDRIAVARTLAEYVLIDTPPGLTAAARAAVLVAEITLIPVGPTVLDLRAAREARDQLRAVRVKTGKPLIAIVPTRLSQTTGTGRMSADVLEGLDELVLPAIGYRVAIGDSFSKGLTVREFTRRDKQAVTEFERLAAAVEHNAEQINGATH